MLFSFDQNALGMIMKVHEGTSFVSSTIFVTISIKFQYLYSSLINKSIVKTIDCLWDSSSVLEKVWG